MKKNIIEFTFSLKNKLVSAFTEDDSGNWILCAQGPNFDDVVGQLRVMSKTAKNLSKIRHFFDVYDN